MKDYMTQQELSDLLGVGRSSISYWQKHNFIPVPKRKNNRPIYTIDDAYEIARIRGINLVEVKKTL